MPLLSTQPDALANTYARALFELSLQQGGQDRVESIAGELEDVIELARVDARFNEFLASRVLGVKERDASLERIFAGRCSALVLNFLRLLNRKNRLSHLPPIAQAYDALMQEHFGRVEVDVYTPAPIDDAQLRSIRDRLAAAIGKEPIIHPYTDPGMIGGVKLRIGDQLIDASVSARLRQMRDRLGTSGGAIVRGRSADLLDDREG
ncbi:MAG: ATP synthase F1 subunit delta [Leptolyngbya sp. PLA3]|nr:MAG: ATP synthase F1 subunit delta [Cyanobacteria bacterium CYA]MCE7969649.1 ATP synthase F1 subunit delta [Leptolyngbya sp. PL-A3]